MSGYQSRWCYILRPPPLPSPTDRYYNELLSFIQSNSSLQESFVAYHNACSDGIIPTIEPKTDASSTQGGTASAGLIVGLIVLFVFLIAFGLAALWYWKKKRRGKQQSSKALSMEEYDKTNYLHNNAVQKKSWSSSSVEGGGTSPQTNGGTKHETGNGEAVVASDDRVKKLKLKETGAINACFTTDELGRNEPESPGIKSIKSDTPLIDSVDAKMVLPNQTIPDSKNQSVLESGDKKAYGSTNVSGIPRANRLPPVETRPKKSPKKKRRSLVDPRKSAPCPQTEALKEDLAENRNSV